MAAIGSLPFREVKKLSITVVTDNYVDALRPDPVVGTRYRAAPCTSIHAEHGLSYYVHTSTSTGKRAFMFDYGVDGRGVLNNMRLLGINLARVDALGLSHGHFDHWGGLVEIVREHGPGISPHTPLYVGVEAFAQRYVRSPTNGPATSDSSIRRRSKGSVLRSWRPKRRSK